MCVVQSRVRSVHGLSGFFIIVRYNQLAVNEQMYLAFECIGCLNARSEGDCTALLYANTQVQCSWSVNEVENTRNRGRERELTAAVILMFELMYTVIKSIFHFIIHTLIALTREEGGLI